MIKKITIQKIILKYYALNRTHVSRKFKTSNRHDESTNNVSLRFDVAHRITKGEGIRSTSRNMFERESNFLETIKYHKERF